MSKTAIRLVRTEAEPSTELDTGPELAGPDPELKRAYLTEDEVERLMRAAATERDRCMILMAYTHGLRVTELTGLQWRQLDLEAGHIRVFREKMGADSVHPLRGREIRMLRKLRRGQPVGSRFVFLTSRGAPMTRNGFYKLLEKAGKAAGIDGCHPHLLRHGCGFKLVNQGMDTLSLAAYLGHVNVQNTQRYAKMSAKRFEGLWRD
jgi:type 1 fimbriae regulatory protein FimB/type 1 fimbriae regulatory protein FimE